MRNNLLVWFIIETLERNRLKKKLNFLLKIKRLFTNFPGVLSKAKLWLIMMCRQRDHLVIAVVCIELVYQSNTKFSINLKIPLDSMVHGVICYKSPGAPLILIEYGNTSVSRSPILWSSVWLNTFTGTRNFDNQLRQPTSPTQHSYFFFLNSKSAFCDGTDYMAWMAYF